MQSLVGQTNSENDSWLCRGPVFEIMQRSTLLLEIVQSAIRRDKNSEMMDIFLTIKHLLHIGANPNVVDNSGRTCLHHLAQHNIRYTDDIVKLLFQAGATPDHVDIMGDTPLLLAASSEHENLELVRMLILAGAYVDKTSFRGWTSLHHAASLGKRKTVRLLLWAGASPDIKNSEGDTPLVLVMTRWCGDGSTERADIAQQLIEVGANVDAANPHGMTSLHHACLQKNTEAMKLLLCHKASLTAVDDEGHNALLFAVASQNVDSVQMLIDAGSDVNFISVKASSLNPVAVKTALHVAIENNHIEILKLLLEHGADPNLTNHLSDSVLHNVLCLKQENVQPMLVLLLSHGASMYDRGGGNSKSLLEILLFNNRVTETRIFLNHGLDLARYNPQTMEDFSPLHEAILIHGSGDMLALLLEYTAKELLDLEHEDQDGFSPLFVAVLRESPDCVKLLLEAGVNMEHTDSNGWSPLEVAVDKKPLRLETSYRCIQYLVEAGAKVQSALNKLVPDDTVDELSEFSQSDFDLTYMYDCQVYRFRFPPSDLDIYEELIYQLEKAKCIVKFRVLYESQCSSLADPIEHESFSGSVKLRSYYEACKTELDQLRNDASIHNSINLYDLLIADKNFHKRVRDDQLYQSFDDTGVKYRFPLYSGQLRRRFKQVRNMHQTWEKAVYNLSRCLKFDANTHYAIIRDILSYLNKDDLHSIAGRPQDLYGVEFSLPF